jgi:hypothetical protein
MTFPDAVRGTVALRDGYREGLQALRRTDQRHVDVENARHVSGSVDVDATLHGVFPNAPRWDYAIGYRSSHRGKEIVYWVEIHPANDGSVKKVLAKLDWLKKWMPENAPKLNAMPRRFVWVSSGKTSFTPNSPQQKQLAAHGLQHRGRLLRIRDSADG